MPEPEGDRPFQWWIHGADADDFTSLLGREWAVFADSDLAEDYRPSVALTLARSSDGRLICTGLVVGLLDDHHPEPVEVTSRALRQIPVAELIGRAMVDESAPTFNASQRQLVEDRIPEIAQVRRKPGPKGHPDVFFREVADLYRRALEVAPRRPVVWMAKELEADRTTVSRWIQRARDKKYLDEAVPGRAGEKRSEEEQA